MALLSLFLCGCNRLEAAYTFETPRDSNRLDTDISSMPALLVNNTDPYEDLITGEVDIHTFIEHYAGSGGYIYGCGSAAALAKDVGIEALRKTEADVFYSVHKVKQGGLLYIFYRTYGMEDISKYTIKRWYYVREKLSYDDFQALEENESTIEDVIAIDPAMQIFKNIFFSDPEQWAVEDYRIPAWLYLEDGLYDLGFEYRDGELILCVTQFAPDFQMEEYIEAIREPYDARILEMDWAK